MNDERLEVTCRCCGVDAGPAARALLEAIGWERIIAEANGLEWVVSGVCPECAAEDGVNVLTAN